MNTIQRKTLIVVCRPKDDFECLKHKLSIEPMNNPHMQEKSTPLAKH